MPELQGTAVNATAKKKNATKEVVVKVAKEVAAPVHQIDATTGFGIPLTKDTVIIPISSIDDKLNGDKLVQFKAAFTHALLNHEQSSKNLFGSEFGELLKSSKLNGAGIQSIADRVMLKCEVVATVAGTNYPATNNKGYFTAGKNLPVGEEIHRLVPVAFVIPDAILNEGIAASKAATAERIAEKKSDAKYVRQLQRTYTPEQLVILDILKTCPKSDVDYWMSKLSAAKKDAPVAQAPVAQAPIVDDNNEEDEDLDNEEL